MLMIGGELGNSSASNREDVRRNFRHLRHLGLNIVLAPVTWELIEPEEGKNNLTCKTDHTAILDVCNQLEYGYMPWSWTGNNKENQWLDLVDPRDWKTLTWWGEQVISGRGGITETAKKASVFRHKQ